MIEKLITYFEQQVSLSGEERGIIKKHIPVRVIEKHEDLLKAGEISSEFYFVIEGCIRLYYINNHEDKTGFFYTENDFVSSYESFTKRVPSKNNLQALEQTKVAVVTHETAYRILELFPKFEFLARIAMEQELSIYQEIIAGFITSTPEQRYLYLQSTKPELIQRIPQYYLATYLGVAPETLSRIRKRIADKNLS